MKHSRPLGRLKFRQFWLSILLVSIAAVASATVSFARPAAASIHSQQSTQLAPSSNTTALMAISPSNISDTSRTSGTVAYIVNVYNSSGINQFDVRLTYNYTVLHGASIDYSNNVFGSSASVLYNCLDGTTPPGSCDTHDGAGVVHLSLFILGNVSVTPPPVGILFKVTFNIVNHGFTQLHLIPGGAFGSDLLKGARFIPLTTRDGYFNNILCGTALCKPPVASFTFSPHVGLPGRSITFNATASKATNPNAVIRQYYWEFGEEGQFILTTSVTSHPFRAVGDQSVTLTVTDTYGISWSQTLTVQVIAVYIQLLAGQITIDPGAGVYPGTLVKISAKVINNSTLTETSNMTIAVEGHLLPQSTLTFTVLPHQLANVTAMWDTTGYVPRVYRVNSFVVEPRGANSTRGNVGTGFVQLIEPRPSGTLSLSLAETTGLGILVLAAVGFAVTRLRRRPSYADEPL